ncbi:MAG: SAM-dependent methyltransferase [Chloroflexi bacterium]|nr:SAM-dependent methyltransferase [Chloroflexota bacterium]
MNTKTWIPNDIPLDKPSPARIYDYYLGGYHNFEIDRMVAEQIHKICPDMASNSLVARALLRRVVEFLVTQTIDQFLDIGSGLPTIGNVHEIAQRANPAARVVYVDIDPIAVAHSKAILTNNPNAAAIQADAAHPDQIISHPVVKDLLDFGRPVGVLLLTVLHYVVKDEKAYGAVRTLHDALVPDSYIAISHLTYDRAPPEIVEPLRQISLRSEIPAKARSYAEILQFFDGLELVEPGLVQPPLWRPEGPDDLLLDQPERSLGWAGVGRKP